MPTVNKEGKTVLQFCRSHQTRRAISAALMEKVGLAPQATQQAAPQASMKESKADEDPII